MHTLSCDCDASCFFNSSFFLTSSSFRHVSNQLSVVDVLHFLFPSCVSTIKDSGYNAVCASCASKMASTRLRRSFLLFTLATDTRPHSSLPLQFYITHCAPQSGRVRMPPIPHFKRPLRGKGHRTSVSGPSRGTSARSASATAAAPRPASPRVRVSILHQSNSGTPGPSHTPSSLSHEERLQEPDPDEDALNEVVMAVDLQHRDTVGCCYYVARDEKLYFMEDVRFGGADIVDARGLPKRFALVGLTAAVRTYIDPTIVLISTSTDNAALDRLDPDSNSATSVNGDSKWANQWRYETNVHRRSVPASLSTRSAAAC